MSTEIKADDRLKEMFELSRLYDYYGSLLNEHSRSIFEDYILNDLSLAEISADVGLSRQGVRDIVVRCSKKLYEYEEALKFVARADKASAMFDELDESLKAGQPDTDRIRNVIGQLRETLDI